MRKALSRFILMTVALTFPAVNFCLALNRDFMYDSGDKRDPFLSLLSGNVALSDLEELSVEGIRLEGIIYDPLQGSLAIVNGEIYRTSDFIGSFEVKEIGKNYVKIAKEDVLYTVKLPIDDAKKET